jgi:hypothetical protein
MYNVTDSAILQRANGDTKGSSDYALEQECLMFVTSDLSGCSRLHILFLLDTATEAIKILVDWADRNIRGVTAPMAIAGEVRGN